MSRHELCTNCEADLPLCAHPDEGMSCRAQYELWADGVHTERARWRKATAGMGRGSVFVIPSDVIAALLGGEDLSGDGPREGEP